MVVTTTIAVMFVSILDTFLYEDRVVFDMRVACLSCCIQELVELVLPKRRFF